MKKISRIDDRGCVRRGGTGGVLRILDNAFS